MIVGRQLTQSNGRIHDNHRLLFSASRQSWFFWSRQVFLAITLGSSILIKTLINHCGFSKYLSNGQLFGHPLNSRMYQSNSRQYFPHHPELGVRLQGLRQVDDHVLGSPGVSEAMVLHLVTFHRDGFFYHIGGVSRFVLRVVCQVE